jgi:site-specific DNA-methyltransferase (adenine-specific)
MDFEPKLIEGDCRRVMQCMPESCIDLIVTSPPYNCKIKYDTWDDERTYDEYLLFMEDWLIDAYRVLRDDGRIAVNLFYEISQKERGGRVFVASDVWQIMKKIGYKWNGLINLKENQSERVKYTAWGSWMSASAPYCYFPGECVLIACKKRWKKDKPGISTMSKEQFMEIVKGEWDYRAETRGATPACFSLDLPIRAVNGLSYIGETVLDPFCGRGTTGAACKLLGRDFIGIDISPQYIEIAKNEIHRMASVKDVGDLIKDLTARGVVMPNVPVVKDYLTFHPKFINVIRDAITSLRLVTDKSNTQLSLEMYQDPEIDDNYLTIYVRQKEYDDDIMDKIYAIRDPGVEHMCDDCGGSVLITTDYQTILDVPV